MSLVFKTPFNAKNTTTRGSQNINSPSGCTLVEGSAEYTENGEYTLAPESADGFSSVAITVDVPSDVNNQSKTVTISENGESTVTYDEDYTGLSSVAITVDVEPDLEAKTATYTSNDTYTISPSQGKDGLSGVTVTVNVPSDVHNQEKSATPTTSSQEVTPDSGYSGLSKVTVSAVTAAIDANITAGNIKKDVEILGVTGNYDPQPDLEAKTVNSSTVQQVITPTAGKDGLSSVTVEPYVLQAKSATPTTSQQVIEPDNDKDGLSSVTVAAVTSSIDANISAGNIKKDVTILGVTGNFDPQPNLDSVNVTPTTSAQQITPSSPVDGYNEINVAAVTSAIDANIAAGNIKEGVTILGVQGTVHEGITPTGNINITDTNSTDVTNYATAQVVDANLAAGNIKSGVTILGVAGSYSPTVSLQNKTATPTTSQQVISADSGYDGLDEVTVSAVTSAIDANIVAGNIKDGVTILGVTGDYTGGGSACVDWSSMGWTCQDVIDSDITEDVAYTASVKDNNSWSNDNKLRFGPKQSASQSGEIFSNCTRLVFVPDFTFTSVAPAYYKVFENCSDLDGVGNISCPNKSSTSYANFMFNNCVSLKKVGTIDMAYSTQAQQMFAFCTLLTYTPTLTNTDSLTNANSMFKDCGLTTIGPLSLSAVTNGQSMFAVANNSLRNTTITSINLSLPNITDCQSMFNGRKLSQNAVDALATTFGVGKITTAASMFAFNGVFGNTYSQGYSTAPSIDFSNCRSFNNTFEVQTYANPWLVTIPVYDFSKANIIAGFVKGQSLLENLGGFTNLGKNFSSSSSSNHTLDLSASSVLTKQSIMNVINALSAPDDTAVLDATLKLSATSYALLDASDIAIATAKNWSVISA